MSWEKWGKYESSIEDYLRLTENYEVRFEYWGGTLALGDGTPVILLGGVAPEGKRPDTALVVISDATKEEVEQLAAFVASLRQSPRREDK